MPEVLFCQDTKKGVPKDAQILFIDYIDILSDSDIRMLKVMIFQSTYALIV